MQGFWVRYRLAAAQARARLVAAAAEAWEVPAAEVEVENGVAASLQRPAAAFAELAARPSSFRFLTASSRRTPPTTS